MRLLKYINKLMLLLLICTGVASCTDERESVQSDASKGYAQFRVFAAGVSRAANQLESLSDAKKIEVTLLQNNLPITQSLNLTAPEAGADYGLTSEKMELTVGEYKLQSYTIYGNPDEVGGDLKTLLVVDLDDLEPINVTSRSISEVEVDVNAVVKGSLSFLLDKDFSNIQSPLSRAIGGIEVQSENLFNYKDIAHVDIYYKKKGTQEEPRKIEFKTYRDSETGLWRTDTIQMQAQNIEVTDMWMYKPYKKHLILKQEMAVEVSVEANKVNSPSVAVKYPANALAVQDYIALYNIWHGMGGNEDGVRGWAYFGLNYPKGANWRFANRPMDEWGRQPGVTLNNSGRVIQLDLGSFNPVGEVPAAIGDLSELEVLYLGTHNDEYSAEEIPDQEAGIYTLDKWALNHNPKYDPARDRMDVARVRKALLYPRPESRVYKSARKQPEVSTYAIKTYQNASGNSTNRITGIHDDIKDLTKLRTLYIANGNITNEGLPKSLPTSLEEIEFYNCDKLTEFPTDLLKDLKLVVLNFSMCTGIDGNAYTTGLTTLFAENNPICKTLQLLYLNYNKLPSLPQNILDNIEDLRMLDVAFNRISGRLEASKENNGEKNFRPISGIFCNNSITEIANAFCGMNDVEDLDFSNNCITVFPNFYKDKADFESAFVTGTLDFSSNYITEFRKPFYGVKTEILDLNWNRFGGFDKNKLSNGKYGFPNDLTQCGNTGTTDEKGNEKGEYSSQIQFLQIASCNLDSITEGSLKGLKHLVALDASGNRLQYMPQEDFNLEVFPYMTGLELSHNAFSVFPVNVLLINSLNSLILPGQYSGDYSQDGNIVPCLKTFPPDIYKHLALRTLDISGNDIKKIPETAFPTQLTKFIVNDNPELELHVPADICKRIGEGSYIFSYDPTQMILGCPILDLEN